MPSDAINKNEFCRRANERSYDILSAEDSTQNIAFEHLYQISKFGFTPVPATRLTVKVPYKMGNSEFLALMNVPQVCSS